MKHRERKGLPEDARDENPGMGEQAGEAVGGIGGTIAGAALGSLAGPIGTILGGIAGAVGGWWAGEKVGRAAEDMGEHDTFYQSHWKENRRDDVEWDDARVGYGLGHIAGRNPDYAGMAYPDIEDDIRSGWNWDRRNYDAMRPYIQAGYERVGRVSTRPTETGRKDRSRSSL